MKYWLIIPVLLIGLLAGCPGKDDHCQCEVSEDFKNKYVGGSCEEVTPNSKAPAANCFYNSERCCVYWGYKWTDPASWGSE